VSVFVLFLAAGLLGGCNQGAAGGATGAGGVQPVSSSGGQVVPNSPPSAGGSSSGGAAGSEGGSGGATSAGGTSTSSGVTSTGGTSTSSGVTSTGGTSTSSGVTGTGGTGGEGGATAASGGSAEGGTQTSGSTAGTGGVGGEGGAGGTNVTAGAPVMSGLTIEPNPNNNLSCYVSWTTDVAASSEVQFGAGGYQFHIVADESVTAHRVLVIGMHASTAYSIKAVSTNAAGSSSLEGSFTSGALPTGLAAATQTVADTSGAQAGWTLANILPPASGGFGSSTPGIMAMYDMDGQPVWYFVNGTTADQRGDVSLRVLPNHNLVLGPSSGEPAKEIDLAGNVLWKSPPSTPTGGPTTDPAYAPLSHYAGKLENGNYVIFRNLTNSAGILGALVQELTPANEVVWSWNLFDHIQPPADAKKDWCHPNSLTVDLANDVFYLSCRFQGVIKAKRSGDQAVLWVLGGQTGGSFAFDPTTAAVFDQHDPEIHADGTILVFDNHYGYTAPPAGTTSRVIEFKLDETAMVATPTFEFPGSSNVDAWYKSTWLTPFWGDADRLANGNVLVDAGARLSSAQSRIFEVRPSDGQVVWQLMLPAGVGTYQAERLSPPPLVQPL
jgi:hypothetical protein